MKRSSFILPFLLFAIAARGQSANGDCNTAMLLCNNSSVAVAALPDAGKDIAEVTATACIDQPYPESNAVWLKWKIEQGGSLGFTILPSIQTDDLDFVLYRSDNGDCADRQELRCMMAGKILGESPAEEQMCTGATGLINTAADVAEPPGCQLTNDNFLGAVTASAGETYLLFVNNYRASNGFLLEFSGDCTFAQAPGDCLTGATDDNFPNVYSTDGAIRFSRLYPNPATDRIRLDVFSTATREGMLEIVDVKGGIVKSRKVSVSAGITALDIPVGELATGVWFVKIVCKDSSCLSRFYKG